MSRSIMNLLRGAVVLGTLAFGLMGCGPEYDRTEITGVRGNNTLGGNISTQRLDVPEGTIISAHIVVWNDDNEQMPLSIRSKDPRIVEIAGVVNDRNYAFFGLKKGTTQIEFVADDSVVLTIMANVTEQPAQP